MSCDEWIFFSKFIVWNTFDVQFYQIYTTNWSNSYDSRTMCALLLLPIHSFVRVYVSFLCKLSANTGAFSMRCCCALFACSHMFSTHAQRIEQAAKPNHSRVCVPCTVPAKNTSSDCILRTNNWIILCVCVHDATMSLWALTTDLHSSCIRMWAMHDCTFWSSQLIHIRVAPFYSASMGMPSRIWKGNQPLHYAQFEYFDTGCRTHGWMCSVVISFRRQTICAKEDSCRLSWCFVSCLDREMGECATALSVTAFEFDNQVHFIQSFTRLFSRMRRNCSDTKRTSDTCYLHCSD